MLFLQTAPHPALQNYIGQYIYVSFNTAVLPSMKQTFFPYDVPGISFFIGPLFLDHSMEHLSAPIFHSHTKSTFAYYNALTTSPYNIYFKENSLVRAFIIPFKPAGFSALFNRDAAELTNRFPDFLSLAGHTEGNRVFEQLAEAGDFAAQVLVLNNFFLKKVSNSHKNSKQIREACRTLIVTDGLVKMQELAFRTNMSLRTLERQFTEQVGVSPKVFARFKRFHHVLSLMNEKNPKAWSDIAYDCGYYDQAHFIKEFKRFTCKSPSEYSTAECVLYNQIILYRNFRAF